MACVKSQAAETQVSNLRYRRVTARSGQNPGPDPIKCTLPSVPFLPPLSCPGTPYKAMCLTSFFMHPSMIPAPALLRPQLRAHVSESSACCPSVPLYLPHSYSSSTRPAPVPMTSILSQLQQDRRRRRARRRRRPAGPFSADEPATQVGMFRLLGGASEWPHLPVGRARPLRACAVSIYTCFMSADAYQVGKQNMPTW
jgi:hypothetical protein